MRQPNWRTSADHALRWALVVLVAMVLHIAYVHLTDRGTTYPPPPTSTTSIATTHLRRPHMPLNHSITRETLNAALDKHLEADNTEAFERVLGALDGLTLAAYHEENQRTDHEIQQIAGCVTALPYLPRFTWSPAALLAAHGNELPRDLQAWIDAGRSNELWAMVELNANRLLAIPAIDGPEGTAA